MWLPLEERGNLPSPNTDNVCVYVFYLSFRHDTAAINLYWKLLPPTKKTLNRKNVTQNYARSHNKGNKCLESRNEMGTYQMRGTETRSAPRYSPSWH